MKDIIVVDLDGTLCNLKHRLHYILRDKHKDYDSFYNEVGGDTVNKWCSKIISLMWHSNFEIYLVSGRPKSCLDKTTLWLDYYRIPYTSLNLLRTTGDHTTDVELKQKWLDDSGFKDRILFTIDDRQRIVDMWRSNGLTCLQCSDWERKRKEGK